MSQPVFSIEPVERFFERASGLGVKILPGLLPVASLKQALYLHNEVPGMSIPAEFLAKLSGWETREDQMALGVEVSQNLLLGLKAFAPGAYLTSGGRKMPVLAQVLKAL